MTHARNLDFNRRAVKPLQCLREGWQLIKDDYWTYFGITLVGMLVGSVAPMGLLMGPAFCGIHLCFMCRENDERPSMNVLFQGFNFLAPSIVATLCMMVPLMVLVMVLNLGFLASIVALIGAAGQQPGGRLEPEFLWSIIALSVAFSACIMFVSIFVQIGFQFVFPLIADKQLSGFEAVKLSFRAAFANFFGLLGLLLLAQLLGMIGMLLCFVGMYLQLPLFFAMIHVAYRQVFPRPDPLPYLPPDEEPPFSTPAPAIPATAVTAEPGALERIQ